MWIGGSEIWWFFKRIEGLVIFNVAADLALPLRLFLPADGVQKVYIRKQIICKNLSDAQLLIEIDRSLFISFTM